MKSFRESSRTTDLSVPRAGKARTARTDLGLALLHAIAIPGVRYTHDEIAFWCGCTGSAIWLIEQKARRKLLNRLLFLKDPVLRDLVANHLPE